eukprot:SAG11_NODE_19306_length_469_cov_2.294595_1_plen_69_part_10
MAPGKMHFFVLNAWQKTYGKVDFLPYIYTFISTTGIKPVLGGAGTDYRSRADFLDFPAPIKTSSEKFRH